jgi:hypothetical protein
MTSDSIAAKVLSRGDALAVFVDAPKRWRKHYARYCAPTDRIEPAAPSEKADEAKKPADVGKDNKEARQRVGYEQDAPSRATL